MRTIPEVFLANEIKQFAIPGGRIEILSCSAAGTVSVSLQDANGVEVTNGFAKDIEAGSYMQPPAGFQRFAITSSVAQTVKFLVSSGDSGTRSVAGTVAVSGTVNIGGTVSVIDDTKSRTLSGIAFTLYAGKAGGGVGYPAVQLWNKADSGKNLVVETVEASSDISSSIYLRNSTAQLANLGPSVAWAKKLGAANSSLIEQRDDAPAVISGTGTLALAQILANTIWKKDFREPYVIIPGTGLIVVLGTMNGRIDANFEWYEN